MTKDLAHYFLNLNYLINELQSVQERILEMKFRSDFYEKAAFMDREHLIGAT